MIDIDDMAEDPGFEARMHDASQTVYQQIVNGGVPGGDVEAALMDAHLNASSDK
ncbi:hypothetical protein ACFV0B_11335 [Streptomyces xanthophaeus]|uniref:hypothetical protein n=1 Tax=Streptomyces xanthophaeus TaxID=67385 RepID=UPI0036AA4A20